MAKNVNGAFLFVFRDGSAPARAGATATAFIPATALRQQGLAQPRLRAQADLEAL